MSHNTDLKLCLLQLSDLLPFNFYCRLHPLVKFKFLSKKVKLLKQNIQGLSQSQAALPALIWCIKWLGKVVPGDEVGLTFNPWDQNLNSHLLSLFISYRSSGEKLIKYQANSSCVITSVILMTTLFYKHRYSGVSISTDETRQLLCS